MTCPDCLELIEAAAPNDRLHGYTVDQHGIITDPGKFEAEYMDAPYWYQQSLTGCNDEEFTDVDGNVTAILIKVSAEDRAVWPGYLGEIYGVIITEDGNGFVRVRHLDESEYTNIVDEAERNVAEQDEDQ